MKLTEEQKEIVNFRDGSIIKACAGSGKTSTLIEYAKARPNEKILYLAFNKSIQLEASRKFPSNTTSKTVHSLAYGKVARKYKINSRGYSQFDIKTIMNIEDGDDYWGHKVSFLIKYKFAKYCGSNYKNIDDIDLSDHLNNVDLIIFYEQNKKTIDYGASQFWKGMEDGKIDITHDFYVKKYSNECKPLQYDIIMVDEAQDISPAFIDIINGISNSKTHKIVCGDFSQAIYGWRSGVGDFSNFFPDLNHLSLSNSFRFRQDIADVCNKILNLKNDYLKINDGIKVSGLGLNDKHETVAIVARTNSVLLKYIINYLPIIDNIFIEGGPESIYYGDGFSLFDILNLFRDKKDNIFNNFIKSFKDFSHLEEYAEAVHAQDLRNMISIVKAYRTSLFEMKIKITEKSVINKKDADIVFTTVHKAKGLEYDVVKVTDEDFINEQQIIDIKQDGDLNSHTINSVSEEINLLYVASSRAKNKLIVPDCMVSDSLKNTLVASRADSVMHYLENIDV